MDVTSLVKCQKYDCNNIIRIIRNPMKPCSKFTCVICLGFPFVEKGKTVPCGSYTCCALCNGQFKVSQYNRNNQDNKYYCITCKNTLVKKGQLIGCQKVGCTNFVINHKTSEIYHTFRCASCRGKLAPKGSYSRCIGCNAQFKTIEKCTYGCCNICRKSKISKLVPLGDNETDPLDCNT